MRGKTKRKRCRRVAPDFSEGARHDQKRGFRRRSPWSLRFLRRNNKPQGLYGNG